jgi:hypothetical protein
MMPGGSTTRLGQIEPYIDADEPHPHTRDELEVGTMTAHLSLTECRRLYLPNPSGIHLNGP